MSWWVGAPRDTWGENVKQHEPELRRLTHDGRLVSTAHLSRLNRKQTKSILESEDL